MDCEDAVMLLPMDAPKFRLLVRELAMLADWLLLSKAALDCMAASRRWKPGLSIAFCCISKSNSWLTSMTCAQVPAQKWLGVPNHHDQPYCGEAKLLMFLHLTMSH